MKQGNCETCGRWDGSLADGMCSHCVERYKVKTAGAVASDLPEPKVCNNCCYCYESSLTKCPFCGCAEAAK